MGTKGCCSGGKSMRILKKLSIFIIGAMIFCGLLFKNTLVDRYKDFITYVSGRYNTNENVKNNHNEIFTKNDKSTDKQSNVPTNSTEADKQISEHSNVIKSDSNNEPSNEINSYKFTAINYEEYYNIVKKSLENFDDNVSIRVDNYNSNTYSLNVINNILDDYYDIDYGVQGANGTIYSDGNMYIVNIDFKYKLSKNQMIIMRDKAKAKASQIISKIITPTMSDLNKELAIHNYIVNNTVYDYDNYVKGTLPQQSFTDYGVLVQGRAVCEGYSKAMFKLLNMAGVKCIVVKGTGNGESHAWNIVKINGNYTQVDATFDDPVTSNRKDVLSYNYFDISDSQMAKDHKWSLKKYPKCSTKQYNRN